MSATLLLYGSVSGLIDGRRIALGSLNSAYSITVKGTKAETTVTIASGANAVVYANALGALNTIGVECDFNTRVVLRDTGGHKFSLGLRGTGTASSYGQPLVITKGNTNTSAVTINSIQVYNQSGSTAKVHFLGIK